jgi:multidrug efflux pump subunit AcrA (membrane-fusion protein)
MFWREEGQVVGMGSALSSGSQTFSVWVRGMDGDRGQERGELYQNMVVRVALEVGGGEEVEEVKGVPLESVVREGREAYVFVELVANMFERRRVVLGRSDDKYVEILRGLQEGERIVVSGVRELQIVRAAIR